MLGRLPFSCAILLLALTDPVAAHTGAGTSGFTSGFQHPLFGFDHLLAMLAVGIWGAQLGGRQVWALPVAFPLVMALGGVAGISGFQLPHVELGIGLSVLTLGLVIMLALRPPDAAALILIAVFAVFHGYAHGVELPVAADPASYAVGFVLATGLIHVAGIGIGLTIGNLLEGKVARGLGSLIAAAGVYFLIT
jgi:urease accessory protein